MFRLGTLDQDGPELFGQVTAFELGAEGEVYVLDGLASEIRVFGPDGAFQRVIGGKGQGPGELNTPAGIALDAEGTLWVMNWGNRLYSGFDPSTGELVREVRRQLTFGSFPWPGEFENGARLIDLGLDDAGDPAILRLDTTFAPSDTLSLPQPSDEDQIMFRRGSMTVASMPEPFAPRPAWAPRPRGGVVVGEGETYRLHRIDFSGDTTLTMELDRERAAVARSEGDSALALFDTMAGTVGDARPDRRPRVRELKPAHGSLFVDDQDRTWVEPFLPTGAAPSWDVFGSDGRFLGSVAMRDRSSFLGPVVRGGRLAIATEVDGFPEVIVYRLEDLPK